MSKNYVNDSQASEIMKFISDTMKFPIMGAGGGFAPIGMYGWSPDYVTGAPQGWLRCEGQEVNIADYPELATFYASQHGASNYWGGDGVTTFAVPDLRGEFPRGAGTNSHANQGDGGAVGEHQDGTTFTENGASGTSGNLWNGSGDLVTNRDTRLDNVSGAGAYVKGTAISEINVFTSRPTNTSGVFFVKATVSGDANAHVYSTEEQVVGTWIDGSPIYERTIIGLSTKVKYDDWVTITTIPSLKYIINAVAYCTESNELKGGIVGCIEWFNDNAVVKCESLVNIDLRTINFVTIQYTKTQ